MPFGEPRVREDGNGSRKKEKSGFEEKRRKITGGERAQSEKMVKCNRKHLVETRNTDRAATNKGMIDSIVKSRQRKERGDGKSRGTEVGKSAA